MDEETRAFTSTGPPDTVPTSTGPRDTGSPDTGPPDTGQPLFGPLCPIAVAHPCMIHEWNELTFLHWRYEPELVQTLLPKGLKVETFDGSAWVGLVPFMMKVQAPVGPAVPWMSNFCETNVRTYVRGPDGTTGVWFMSLDAARLAAVITARVGFGLPYFWSKMRIERGKSTIGYRSQRRWPTSPASTQITTSTGRAQPTSHVSIDIGERFRAEELTQLDHFLTARWRLFSVQGQTIRSALAEHEPWPLHRATVRALDDGLVAASGLPAPVGPPLVHYSPGVTVRIGLLHRVRASRDESS